ncbi:MAG: branched-chain amino acid ABC transporter permease [Streptomycetaceae bacterium]|nr:MAG: branched-chain amino acid ABC transporter permease [Streptomycetaceae bacterium]
MFTFIDTVIIGLTSGAVYSLMAISLVLVWRSTRVINFAQAGQALLSTYIGYSFIGLFDSYWIALFFAIVLGAGVSALIEILFMRTLFKRNTGPIAGVAPIIATLGLLGLIHGLIGIFMGGKEAIIRPPVSNVGYTISGHTLALSPLKLVIVSAVLFLMISLSFIFTKTNIGLALRASAYSPEIARLAGVKVDAIRTLGWALAGAAGAAAGMLQTPNGTGALSPDSLEFSLLLVLGFIAAVIGGLESLVGAVIGGLLLGLVLAFVIMYVSATLPFMTAFLLLLGVLLVRPQGIMGRKVGRRA